MVNFWKFFERKKALISDAPKKRLTTASLALVSLDAIPFNELDQYPTADELFREHLPERLNTNQRFNAGNLRSAYQNEETWEATGKITPGNFVRICRLIREVKDFKKYPYVEKFLYEYLGKETFSEAKKHHLWSLESEFLRSVTAWSAIGVLDTRIPEFISGDLSIAPEELWEEELIQAIQNHYKISEIGLPEKPEFKLKRKIPAHVLGLLPYKNLLVIFQNTRDSKKPEERNKNLLSERQNDILEKTLRGRAPLSNN